MLEKCFAINADLRSSHAMLIGVDISPQLVKRPVLVVGSHRPLTPSQAGSLLPFLCLLKRLRPWPSTLMLLRPLLPLRSSSPDSLAPDALLGTLTSSSISLCSLVGDVGASRVKLFRAKGLRPLRTADEPGW